jgi:hypothetical protein
MIRVRQPAVIKGGAKEMKYLAGFTFLKENAVLPYRE